LAVAGFASQAQVRVMDSLLPQIASDLHTTIGLAAMVVTAYAVTHGSIQLVIGPISDRFGKYRTVALTCAIGAVLVAVCGTVSTLPQLALARLATGAAAGWIIPISMAYVGDVTPHDRLQQILGRYISGQILGQLFGQAAGGVLGDLLVGATCSSCLPGCSLWRLPAWCSSSLSIRRPANAAAVAREVCLAVTPRS
jgi:MFS family permease